MVRSPPFTWHASSHKCEIVKSFLAFEKVKVLNHPPYLSDLSPCDFFLFPRLKKMLSGNKYMSRSSLGSAIYQCLQQIPKEDYLSAFRDWIKSLQKCVSVKGEYWFVIAPACSRVRYRRPIFCPSVRPSVRLSTFMSTFDIYVKVF